MASTSSSRTLQHTWNPAWATAPPAACTTLHSHNNQVSWGETCVSGGDDDASSTQAPFGVNTACMPWITPQSRPPKSAFYSPATACPDSWTPVATQTAKDAKGDDKEQWLDGEIGLQCCPAGFQADGKFECKPDASGKWPVAQCGDADEEENEIKMFEGARWPAEMKIEIPALMLRYRESDVNATRPAGNSSVGSQNNNDDSSGALSTGAIAGIATAIPIFVIASIAAVFLLWRRKRKRDAAALDAATVKTSRPSGSIDISSPISELGSPATYAAVGSAKRHETPEWNNEMEDTGGARYHHHHHQQPAELMGFARPVPVELDGTPVLAEVGDTHVPHRPGSGERG